MATTTIVMVIVMMMMHSYSIEEILYVYVICTRHGRAVEGRVTLHWPSANSDRLQRLEGMSSFFRFK